MALNLAFKIIKATLHFFAQKERQRFIEACKNPEKAQARLKKEILKKSKINFPERPQSYKDFENHLNNLSTEPIEFFETTSGSTGAKKSIPYTKSLLKSFEKMFLIWAHDLAFNSNLELKSGKFFMSISPQIGEKAKDDRQYLSLPLQLLMAPFMVSNPSSHSAKTSAEFFLQVSLDLLNSPELEIISIWSPSYFLSFLNYIEQNRTLLASQVKSDLTREILSEPEIHWQDIWPHLKLISCWHDAQAQQPAEQLKKKLSYVTFQGKGLLLTEAPITIPWSEAGGTIPLITETFLEFLTEDGKILGIGDLKKGSRYTVLSSQFNGFLRYNTNDQVEVTGYYYKTPILKFLGRIGNHSDLAGEKLSEELIRSIIKPNFFFFILPYQNEKTGYEVYVEEEAYDQTPLEIENVLLNIHHYKLARDLKQLEPLTTIKVKNLSTWYQNFHLQAGIQLGDIKEKILFSDLKQSEKFRKWIEKELLSFRRDP